MIIYDRIGCTQMQDAHTYAKWGVDFLKSDNCASYALDPSVRFGAMRDGDGLWSVFALVSVCLRAHVGFTIT